MAKTKPAIMPDEKYIQIDKDGKPDFINKAAGQNIPGVPADDDLCFIEFKKIKIPKAVPDEDHPGKMKSENVDGYEFTCVPSDKCKAKNKDMDEKREKLGAAIKKLEGEIKDPMKKHEQAANEKKKAELESELHKIDDDCLLKFIVGTGGDDKTKKRLAVDEIKAKKIEFVFCHCQKVKAPEPPKKPR